MDKYYEHLLKTELLNAAKLTEEAERQKHKYFNVKVVEDAFEVDKPIILRQKDSLLVRWTIRADYKYDIDPEEDSDDIINTLPMQL